MSTPSPNQSISLHVSIYISPHSRAAFLEAFKPCFDAVRAEPACKFFEVFTDPEDEGHFHWVENWIGSVKWFMTEQITKPYYAPYLAATEPMFVKPREVKFYHRMDDKAWVL
ncbi:MAG: hypothetical protein Q9169_001554 [Polycauliona sp. 2 TL-2023]